MARQVAKLTALAVTRTTVPGYYSDGAGLWLQVSGSGSKSFVFRFTRAGKTREMGLGPAHTVSLTEARAKAREARVLLLEGRDPIDTRQAAKLAAALAEARVISFVTGNLEAFFLDALMVTTIGSSDHGTRRQGCRRMVKSYGCGAVRTTGRGCCRDLLAAD
ncbi:MAG: Arm DNA-binding domain-containing protein [Candidatus Accumulibacter sp. UW25]|jgi:hypothetical protein